jgi:hypothetical protein
MCRSGKSPAHITAKIVIASAERLIAVEEEDRRDQGAGVADADPEDEVGDVERPAHGLVEPPDADAGRDLVGGGRGTQPQSRQRDGEAGEPAPARPGVEGAADVLRDLPQRGAAFDPAGAQCLGL